MRNQSLLGRVPWAMVTAAFALRVGAMCVLHSYRFPATQDHYLFGTEMGRVARSLVAGTGFGSPLHGQTGPTAMVGPIYPLLIAAAFKVWGVYTITSAVILLTLNALFSAATAAAVYFIGKTAADERTGIWAGWLWAFYPFAIYWPIRWVWDTGLSTLLFGLVFLATLRLSRSMRAADGTLYGLLWGVTVLTNTTYVILLPLFLGWLCYGAARRETHWVGPTVAVLVAFGLALTPWIVRNELVFGRLLLRSNLGLELALGNAPGASDPGAWQRLHPATNAVQMARYRTLGELRYMAEKQREALNFIARRPASFVRATGTHVVFFWFGVESPNRILHFPELLFGIPAILALWGFWAAVRSRSSVAFPFAVTIVAFPLVYYVTHPDLRFRHLIEPELVVLATYGTGTILQWTRKVFQARAVSENIRLRPAEDRPDLHL